MVYQYDDSFAAMPCRVMTRRRMLTDRAGHCHFPPESPPTLTCCRYIACHSTPAQRRHVDILAESLSSGRRKPRLTMPILVAICPGFFQRVTFSARRASRLAPDDLRRASTYHRAIEHDDEAMFSAHARVTPSSRHHYPVNKWRARLWRSSYA